MIPIIGPIIGGITGFINILGLILQVMRYFPEIIGTIRSIMEMIKELKKGGQVVQTSQLNGRLRAALEHLKKTGDAGPLHALAADLSEKVKCTGVGCPPSLVSE